MKRVAQMMGRALLGALVLALHGDRGLVAVPDLAGHAAAAIGAGLLVFPPTAPWWSAGLTTPGRYQCLSLDGFWWHARPRHAGRLCRAMAYGVSADGAVVVGVAENAAGQPRAFRWQNGCHARPRHAGRIRLELRLLVFPPTAPWWSAGLPTPHGRGVPFAGRWMVGCRTSARWAAMRARLMVFPPTAPWWSAGLTTPQGRACLSLDGGWWDAGPRHAGRQLERGLWCFRRRRRGGRLG
jgi:probable HAF family extracellular repeat protein